MLSTLNYLGYSGNVLGDYSGSVPAAAALIDYTDGSNEFVYTLDVSGNNILTNQGTGTTTYDGLLNTGESLLVSAGQEFDIPIHYTLGTEDYNGTMSGGSSITFTDLTGGDWNLEKTDSSTNAFNNRILMEETTGIATGSRVLISFNASYVSGGPLVLVRAWNGSTYALLDAEYTVVEGANEIEIPSAGVGDPIAFNNPYGTNYDIDFTNISTKEITNPNAYLLMYDTTNTECIGLGEASLSGTTHTISAGTYGHIAPLSKVPSATALSTLETDIHAIADLWFGRIASIDNLVKADIQHFYIPKVEQGLLLQDLSTALGSEIMTNGDFATGTTTGFVESSGTWDASTFEAVGTIDTAETLARLQATKTPEDATYYWLTFDYDATGLSTSITVTLTGGWAWASGSPGVLTDSGTATALMLTDSANSGQIRFNLNGVATDSGSLDNISLKKVTGITIPNYLDTMYTNADLNPKGQQTAPIVFDGTGRATNVDYAGLNIYGDAFINTQWTVPGSFTITENGTEYTTTAKTSPYTIDDTSAGGGVISEITQFEVEV